MFTGIVQAMGKVREIQRNPFGVRLILDRTGWAAPAYALEPGASISISGVCLTVVRAPGDVLEFDVIAETLARTNLGDLQPGRAVNFEPAVAAHAAMGGHIVQGHVDGVGVVTAVKATAEEWRVTIRPPADLMDYIVPKGSVTVDGVSLTLAAVGPDWFDVALIPTTLQITTLGRTKAGDRTNLETDIIAKTIVHYLRRMREAPASPGAAAAGEAGGGAGAAAGISRDLLRQAGFVAE